MKKTLMLLLFGIMFSGCSSIYTYYQVYKVENEGGSLMSNGIVYDDANAKIIYNFWQENGNPGFVFSNKTEGDITIDLTKSHFIMNGFSSDYYQNRVFTSNFSSDVSGSSSEMTRGLYSLNSETKTAKTSASTGTNYVEKPTIVVPPKTSVNISEFNVSSSRFVHCDLPKAPSMKKVKSVKFEKSGSPFTFYNLITYTAGSTSIKAEHRFYVSEITNYPENGYMIKKTTSDCGTKLMEPIEVFPKAEPNGFYVMYKFVE
ncbi:MAG: hypothetical protein IPN36_01625 [Bacteroidetes bacterium]|nr:hypothetical protein [Bacteroidota bacterium]